MQQPIIHEPVAVFLTIVAVILVAPLLSERIRLPGIVGLMIGGILIGPHGFGLLGTGGTMELLATVGLIYLMFSAGLEIDLQQFGNVRNKALLFGLAGFAFPQLSGFLIGRLLNLGLEASILLGAVYASHTLVAFPLLNRLGIMKNEAVATTVGATVLTDVASLLVLAVIVGARGQQAAGAYVLQLVALIILYTLAVMLGLPRLGKAFFRRFSGRTVEFQFVLAALFVAALAAELIGMHPIVGAFLAGLAINSTLPEHSVVSGRVLFVGESLFIPIFLIFIGMRTDPLATVANWTALRAGLLLTVAVYATKFLAAWLVSKTFGYGRNEMMTMWGLSQAQAAATLATLLVGIEAGVLPEWIFDGAILMVLATTITSPLIVQRFGPSLQPVEEKQEPQPIFKRILVPVANPDNQENLIRLAALLARHNGGKIMPVHVARDVRGEIRGLDYQDRLIGDLKKLMAELELETEPMRKVSESVPKGIKHAAVEGEASSILIGWHGATTFRQEMFGTVIDRVIDEVDLPVMVARVVGSVNGIERVFLGMPTNCVGRILAGKVLEVAASFATELKVPLDAFAAPMYIESLEEASKGIGEELEVEIHTLEGDLAAALQEVDRPGSESLVVVPSSREFSRRSWRFRRIPRDIARKIEDSLVLLQYP